jgi:hypothetical protein
MAIMRLIRAISLPHCYLRQDPQDLAGADGPAPLPDGEARVLVHRDRRLLGQLNSQNNSVALIDTD